MPSAFRTLLARAAREYESPDFWTSLTAEEMQLLRKNVRKRLKLVDRLYPLSYSLPGAMALGGLGHYLHNMSDSLGVFLMGSVGTLVGAALVTLAAGAASAHVLKPTALQELDQLLVPLKDRPDLCERLMPSLMLDAVATYRDKVAALGRDLLRADWNHMQEIAAAHYAERRRRAREDVWHPDAGLSPA